MQDFKVHVCCFKNHQSIILLRNSDEKFIKCGRHDTVLIINTQNRICEFLMGNSAAASRLHRQRRFEDAAVQGNPEIQCDHVGDQLRRSSLRDDKGRSPYKSKTTESNRLSIASTSRQSQVPVVEHTTDRRQEELQSERDASTAAVESLPTITVDRPQHPIPVITVTRFGDEEKAKPSPIEQTSHPTPNKTNQTAPIQNQPGLTGVPRHKPIQRSSQTTPDKPRPLTPKRTPSASPRPLKRHSSRSTSATLPPRPTRSTQRTQPRLVSHSPSSNQTTKVSQLRPNQREYERLGSPSTIRRRSSSTGPHSKYPTPMNTPRRTVSREISKRAPGLPQSRLEYTFYIRDTNEQRRPFNENTADAIARGCQCSIELISLGKGFPPVFHKGIRVCPVTITTTNMTNLRKCLARLDAHYPEFNAKAFMPR